MKRKSESVKENLPEQNKGQTRDTIAKKLLFSISVKICFLKLLCFGNGSINPFNPNALVSNRFDT